jgi:hypothetical protein
MKYLFLASFFVFGTLANAQSFIYPRPSPEVLVTCRDGSKPKPILLKDFYKIKVVTGTSSETARVADYVEFTTMEPIYSDEPYPSILFDKGTAIYAVVTRRGRPRAFLTDQIVFRCILNETDYVS